MNASRIARPGARASVTAEVRERIAMLVGRKRERLASEGARPRCLDLFSGCGGLSLGFDRAGFESLGGVDSDLLAASSYARNLHNDAPAHAVAIDITQPDASPRKVLARWGHEDDWQEVVDLIIGGPPCPAFTRIGRAKLRELRGDPQAYRNDPRAALYLPYLNFVEELAPVALVMENVPDLLNFGGHNLGEEIAEALDDLGYVVRYTVLNTANYGVPQMRDRFFLFAIHDSVGVLPGFPVPSHRVELPRGYESARNVALKLIDQPAVARSDRKERWVPTPLAPADAPYAVSAREATLDLPHLKHHLDGLDRRGARRFDEPLPYRKLKEVPPYVAAMRAWPGFEGDGQVWDQVTRCLTERDYRIFKLMEPGDEYPRAVEIAEELLATHLVVDLGIFKADRRTKEYKAERAAFVPPYKPTKFPNKWRKMEADAPARTLTAHLGKDTYSHIHYDSQQARTITVREAARLQSFPDGFVFAGTMNPAFRQIGNSVPPLLAFHIARALKASLGLRIPERTTGETIVDQEPGVKNPSSGASGLPTTRPRSR